MDSLHNALNIYLWYQCSYGSADRLMGQNCNNRTILVKGYESASCVICKGYIPLRLAGYRPEEPKSYRNTSQEGPHPGRRRNLFKGVPRRLLVDHEFGRIERRFWTTGKMPARPPTCPRGVANAQ